VWERLDRTRVLRRISARPAAGPALLPRPDLPEGTELLPQIRHIVVLMMENHSYDNYLGMLAGRGDGFTLGPDGQPVGSNANLAGTPVPLRRAALTTQLPGVPTQSWHASHIQFADGACDGFVRSIEQTLTGANAEVPMRYWTETELPFYYGLARTFPLATRWFSSCLGPTFPNRRFLISGTAHGLIDDLPFCLVDYPESGTIFDHLTARGISWANYHHVSSARIRWRRLSRPPGLGWMRLLAGALAGVFGHLVP
jgi:phospholipase C